MAKPATINDILSPRQSAKEGCSADGGATLTKGLMVKMPVNQADEIAAWCKTNGVSYAALMRAGFESWKAKV